MNPVLSEILLLVIFFLLIWILSIRAIQNKNTKMFLEKTEQLQKSVQFLTNENRGNKEKIARKREVGEKILAIIKMLNQNLSPKAIPSIAVRIAKDFFHASKVGFFVPIDGSDKFTLVEGVGFFPDIHGENSFSADQGIIAKAIRGKIVVSKADSFVFIGGETRISPVESDGIEIDFVAPIFVKSKIMGVLVIGGSRVDIAEEKKYVMMFADLLSNAFEKASENQLAKSVASIDELTGLHNRRYLIYWSEIELRRAKNYMQSFSLCILDIDHFKEINDSYGHHVGDQVLRKVAVIIRGQTRSSNLVARYGGEEFVVVMPSSNKQEAHRYANNLRQKIEDTEVIIPGCDGPIGLTISGGVASYPIDGESISDLIISADQAMYKAKQTGRNEVVIAQPVGIDGVPII